MKKRLLTALVGVSAAIGWLFTMYTPFFAIIMAVVSVIAIYEMLNVFNIKNLPVKIVCMLCAAAILIYVDHIHEFSLPMFPIVSAYVIFCLVIMVMNFETLKFEQIVCALFSSTAIPIGLSCVLLFRDVYITFPDAYTKNDGIFFILLSFFCSWLTDACALFAGMAFGKHKLAPKISPKKTVEGAIGGVVGNTILCVVLYFVFKKKFNLSEDITLPFTIILSVALAVISIFGDLAASTIKRHQGVKDFGNILPGHGGIMDRFDSSLFVFPVLYGVITVVNSIG